MNEYDLFVIGTGMAGITVVVYIPKALIEAAAQ